MACCAGLLMLLKKNISEFKIQIWDKEADNRIDKSTDTEPPNNFIIILKLTKNAIFVDNKTFSPHVMSTC